MGRQKALLPVPPDGLPLVVHVLDALPEVGAGAAVVVANEAEVVEAVMLHRPTRARCVADSRPDSGPLGGIAAGLTDCQAWAAVVGCDMPLVRAEVFAYLWQMAQELDAAGLRRWDAIVPRVDDRTQTMHALYHRDVLPVVEQMLDAGELSVRALFARIRVRYVTESELAGIEDGLLSFSNVNTPKEWAAILPRLARRPTLRRD